MHTFAVISLIMSASDTLPDPIERHIAAVAALATGSCKVESELLGLRSPINDAAVFAWNNGRLRVKGGSGPGQYDSYVVDGIESSFTGMPGSGKGISQVGTIMPAVKPLPCDIFAEGLLSFASPVKYRAPLSSILAAKHAIKSIKKERRDGYELFHVSLSHEKAHLDIWLDPSVNYLARFAQTRSLSEDAATVESEVVSFQEVSPRLFFPKEARLYRLPMATPLVVRSRIRVADVVVNKPLPHSTFVFRFPPGIKVTDHYKNAVFITDASGQPKNLKRDVTGEPVRPQTTPPPPANTQVRTVTSDEPSRTGWWILPVSAGAVVIGLGLLVLHRIRRSSRA